MNLMISPLMTLSLMLSLVFLYSFAPLPKAAVIISQTVTTALLMALTSNSPWLALMLSLIFLSAMMVIFTYVSSLTANKSLTPSLPSLMALPSFSVMILLIVSMILMNQPNLTQTNSNMMSNLELTASTSVYKLYGTPYATITVLLISYLLMTLLVVVRNSSEGYKPLRSGL